MEVFSVFATLSLVDLLSSPLDRIRSGMASLQGQTGGVGKALGNLTMAMAPLAMGAAAIVSGLGLLAMSTLATEKALGELATLGMRDLAAVEAAALQASNTMAGITKPDFIAAAYDIKSGIASLSDEGVAAFTALAAKTAQATKSTVADMTNLGATAYGIHKRMYAGLTDEAFGGMLYAGVAASVQAFKTTGSAMNQAMSNLGAAATQAKRPLEEQLAVLGTLQNSMDASVAGTAYKSFFRDATRGFTALGITAVDSAGQMRAMPDLLADLEKKLGPLTQAKLDNITKAFGAETGGMIQNLLGKSDELRRSIDSVGTAIQGGTGFIDAMAASVNAGLGPSLALLRQRTVGVVEELGKHLAPSFSALATALGMLMIRVQEWAKTPFVGYVLKIAGAISSAVLAFTALTAGLWALSGVGVMVGKALAPLKALVLGISWPIWLLVAAAAGLYFAFRSNFGGIADVLSGWWRSITLVVRGVLAVFQSLKDGVGEIRGELATDIKAAGLVGLVTTVSRVVYRIREFFLGIWEGLNFDRLTIYFIPAIVAVRGALHKLGAAFTAFFGGEVTSASSTWRSFGKTIGSALQFGAEVAAKALTTLISWGLNAAKILGGAWSSLSAVFDPIGAAVQATVNRLAEAFGRVWAAITGIFSSLTGNEIKSMSLDWETLGNVLGNILAAGLFVATKALELLSVPLSAVMNLFAALIALCTGDIPAATEALRAIFVGMGEFVAVIGDVFGVGDAIRAVWAEVVAYLDGINLFESGAKLLSTFIDGIKSMAGSLYDSMAGALQSVRNLLPFSDAKEGPLSTLTLSGTRMMSTLAEGVTAGAASLLGSVTGALSGVGNVLSGWWSKVTGGAAAVPLAVPPAVQGALPGAVSQQTSLPPVTPPSVALPPVDMPPVSGPSISEPAAAGDSGRREAVETQATTGGVTIHIANLNLPNVSNKQEFVSGLQGLVAEYEGA